MLWATVRMLWATVWMLWAVGPFAGVVDAASDLKQQAHRLRMPVCARPASHRYGYSSDSTVRTLPRVAIMSRPGGGPLPK
eukprot:3179120-Pyramimonas_sp.AAC.1